MSRRERGASYIEVLVATALVGACLVPALDALRTGLVAVEVGSTQTAQHYRMVGRLEELLATPFAALDAEAQALGSPGVASAVYSDAPTTPDRRLVYLSRYDGDDVDPADGDPFTGVDEGLLWIRVEIENTSLAIERLRADGE